MGYLDEGEMCELVGLYLSPLLQKRVNKNDNELYRADGSAVLRNANGGTERILYFAERILYPFPKHLDLISTSKHI